MRHILQTKGEKAPIVVENRPTLQSLQAVIEVDLGSLDHVPATQFIHWVFEVRPVYDDQVPTGQDEQIVEALPAATEDQVPSLQLIQKEIDDAAKVL